MSKLLFIVFFLGAYSAKAQSGTTDPVTRFTSPRLLCVLKEPDPRHHYLFSSHTVYKNGAWGYEIFADGTLLLQQYDMPGKTAGTGFPSKAAAEQVALYIIHLLEHPTRPAVVYVKDLERMGIQ